MAGENEEITNTGNDTSNTETVVDETTKIDEGIKLVLPPDSKDWLKTDKYGADPAKAIIEQAKAYVEAEKFITKTSQDSSEIRKQLAAAQEVIKNLSNIKQTDPTMSDEEVLEQAVQDYNLTDEMGALNPKGLVKFLADFLPKVVENQNKDISDAIYEDKFERVKQSLSSDKYYGLFKDEIDNALSKIPPKERYKAKTVEDVKKAVYQNHISEIVAYETTEAIRKQSGEPEKPAKIEGAGDIITTKKTVYMTPEQRKVAERNGLNPDVMEQEIADKISGKRKAKEGWGAYSA